MKKIILGVMVLTSFIFSREAGDRVCQEMETMASAFWGSTFIVTAYVEEVNSDNSRIKIRISDTHGNEVRYKGQYLHSGIIIWDDTYGWGDC